MSSLGASQPIALLQHEFERLSDRPDRPPSGYVFVPKGDVYITRNWYGSLRKWHEMLSNTEQSESDKRVRKKAMDCLCKFPKAARNPQLTLCKDRKTNERLGIHCFQQIVEAVKEDAAVTEEKRKRAVAAKDSRDHKYAQELLLEFFPSIPENACTEILEHGFQKGSGRVGRSQILEDKLKVQLAVNAHIRHRWTQYDSILAANKGQDVKIAAREIVHGQVQAIADSWRKSLTSVPRGSAAILEANRQRRTRRVKARKSSADEAQMLEGALSGLRLSENQPETGARAEAAQRVAQKVARKVAREATFGRTNWASLRQYELDPSIRVSKDKMKSILRLQRELKERPEKRKHLQIVHERQHSIPTKPTKREGNRKLRITGNGVELEPVELDEYVPDQGPKDVQGPSEGHGPRDDQPRKPRLLRSNYRAPGRTPTNNGGVGDTPGDGVQLQRREHDRYIPDSGPNSGIDPSHKSRYPLRSRNRTTVHLDTNNDKKPGPVEESPTEGRLLAADSEWMDIDDISLRTAGVHLA